MSKRYLVFGLIALLGLIVGMAMVMPVGAVTVPSRKAMSTDSSTADHSHFKELDRDFTSGPEVTKACLKCHNLADSQIHNTIHWTWAGRQGDKGDEGKAITLNNF